MAAAVVTEPETFHETAAAAAPGDRVPAEVRVTVDDALGDRVALELDR